ncbi:aryl-alcohol dehydrogenase [NADP+] [Lactarius sanguifluus]|nr:aryl-alcohol dehydrogenase [NADP+] [Lactarius sanguifluus]
MSSKPLYAPPPAPVSKLARYRTLSPLAGVRVSPLCFGGLGIGDKWQQYGMGSMDKETSFKLLDAYFDLGGNFIDTANHYQDGASEEFIGEWAEKRRRTGPARHFHEIHRRTTSVARMTSLTRKLRTSYIDILYVHWWDYNTSVEEVMNSLHILVLQGKVLYLGISDAPAVGSFQGESIRERSRKDALCRSIKGLRLHHGAFLAAGGSELMQEEARRRESGEKGRMVFHSNWERTEEERKMSLVLEEVAQEVGVEGITAVAIAYHLLKMPYVFPITGCRKAEHLRENLKALDITLTPEQTQKIEDATTLDIGFPFKTFGTGATPSFGVTTTAHTDLVPLPQAVRPSID